MTFLPRNEMGRANKPFVIRLENYKISHIILY